MQIMMQIAHAKLTRNCEVLFSLLLDEQNFTLPAVVQKVLVGLNLSSGRMQVKR